MLHRTKSAMGALLILAAFASAAEARTAGDKNLGRAVAEAKCANCHSIEPGAKSSPEFSAPPFAEMITQKQLTGDEIEGWLMSSHNKMPSLTIPPDGRANLVAYIKSLVLTK
jgi:mono/diheme cytochrome c family protein